MLNLFEQRLQICLRTLAKTYNTITSNNNKKDVEKNANLYKSMFGLSLRSPSTELGVIELGGHLNLVISKLIESKNS